MTACLYENTNSVPARSVRGHYDQSVNEARVEGSLNTQISIS